MKKLVSLVLLLTLVNLYTPALAKVIEVKEGTRIPITVTAESTSKTIQAGQAINAVIDADVVINNTVVFKKGDNATIKVSDVKKAGFIGNAGEIQLINGEAVDALGNKHSIEYNQKIIGDEKTYPKVLLATSIFFLFPLALFGFVKGGQAKISPNKIIDVSVRNGFNYSPEKL